MFWNMQRGPWLFSFFSHWFSILDSWLHVFGWWVGTHKHQPKHSEWRSVSILSIIVIEGASELIIINMPHICCLLICYIPVVYNSLNVFLIKCYIKKLCYSIIILTNVHLTFKVNISEVYLYHFNSNLMTSFMMVLVKWWRKYGKKH